MATITRGATVLHPTDVLGWDLARPGHSVSHPILGTSDVEVTGRPHGPVAGELRTLWPTKAAAETAVEELAVPGGAWTFDFSGTPLVARIVGDLRIAAEDDAGSVWSVTVGVQGVPS